MNKVYRLYIDDKISADGFAHAYRPLEERLAQLKDQIPDLQGEIDFLKIRALSSDHILSEAQNLYGRWSDLTAEEKRNIIETLTERIEIAKDDITIDLCYLPSSSEVMAEKQRNLRDSSPPPA